MTELDQAPVQVMDTDRRNTALIDASPDLVLSLRAEVLARGGAGLHMWRFNPAGSWEELPVLNALSDAAGWDRPEYYSTIRCANIVGGIDRGEVIARGGAGLHTWRLNQAGGWVELPILQIMSDVNGWDQPQYYSTIQCASISGDGRAEMLARGSAGLHSWRYRPAEGWEELPVLKTLSDAKGWDRPQYYSTIQCANIISGDGRSEVLARGADGLHAWRLKPAGGWEELPVLNALSDANGWNQPQYYSTIQCADIDGDGRDEVLARGASGLHVWRLNPGGGWEQLPVLANLSDSNGWNQPQYYSTIQCANISGDGRDEVLARGSAGLHAWRLKHSGGWVELPLLSVLRDDSGWDKPEYYSTIQCANISGDGRAEVLARGSAGLRAWRFNQPGAWEELPVLANLSDSNGWNRPQYYSTIQCANVRGY